MQRTLLTFTISECNNTKLQYLSDFLVRLFVRSSDLCYVIDGRLVVAVA